ncbi:division/cell wall cluster transcriptional repressor MraZ [bacterium]|nr:division/cell wall cluster transcriptional repressor MraZ [bacterium]
MWGFLATSCGLMWYTGACVRWRVAGCVGMFRGEFSHQLDSKGRLIIPARYREALTTGAMLTRGLDHHLVIYPQAAWRHITDQIETTAWTDFTGRALRRLLLSGAVDLSLDRQGRAVIPPYLRDYAELDERVLVIGAGTTVELWQPERWQSALDGVVDALAGSDIALRLGL